MKRLLVLFASLLTVSCSSQEQRSDRSSVGPSRHEPENVVLMNDEELAKAKLSFGTADLRELPRQIKVAASVQPDETMTMPVSSLVPGRAEEVRVKLGDAVSKGQVLTRVRSDEIGTIEAEFLQALLDLQAENRQKILELTSEINQLIAKVDFLTKQNDRKKYLFENKIGSKAELEFAQSELLQATAALDATRAKEQAQRSTAKAKEEALYRGTREHLKMHGIPESEVTRLASEKTVKSMFDIKSPKGGFISAREIDPGEAIAVNQQLFVITDLSRVWLIGQVFEKDLKDLSQGMPVSCTVNSFPGEHFEGLLEYVGTQLDAHTRSLPIRASAKNPGNRLKPNMFGEILITTGYEHLLTIPEGAIQTIGETQIVFVKRGPHKYERRVIKPGNEVGKFVEIVQGLRSGETVVDSGSIDLLGKTLQTLKQ